MDGMYGLHTSLDYGGAAAQPSALPETMATPADYQNYLLNSGCFHDRIFESDHIFGSASASASTASIQADQEEGNDDVTRFIKAKIASHPRYPSLLQAYIDCHKVGAPPEIDSFLEEIRRENVGKTNTVSTRLGTDPELDEFMETYRDILVKYKSDLARPFDEASSFLNQIQLQLSNLCNGASRTEVSEEAAGSSEDDCSGGETETPDFQPRSDERDLKDKLMRKYSGYISSLKQDFARKKKKGKLPKEAKQALLEWWNMHYKWPYPTEADKVALAESTGLNQKQINNWFINQRKRHWKPSENMQFAVMDTLSSPFFIYD